MFFKRSVIVFSALALWQLSCTKDNGTGNNDEPPVVVEELVHIDVTTVAAIVDEPKTNGQIVISKDGETSYTGNIGIEFRGASSQMFPKKSYGFETRDGNNEDLNVALLDFPEEEDWILYAPYSDKSLLRNILIYDLSRDMGNYASRTQFVEVTENNAYKGLYVFMEKLKRDKDRIDISKLESDENTGEDLTGGYILKIDKLAGTNNGDQYNAGNSFSSAYSPAYATAGQTIHFLYEYPDAEDITPEQKTYISTYISDFETALAGADFDDPEVGYAAYINVATFIDFFLLNELSNNIDGYRLSTFMHKNKNDKLNMGPIWDFNLAFGNANYCSGESHSVWAYRFNERCPEDFWQVPFWWSRLLEDPNYVSQLKARWATLRGSTFSEAYILGKIDAYQATLSDANAIDKNFSIWNILGSYIWPNYFVGNTHEQELNYLKNWITNRLSWMDAAIDAL